MIKYFFHHIGIVLLLAIVSCKKEEHPVTPLANDSVQTTPIPSPPYSKENLVSIKLIGEYPKALITALAANSEYKDFAKDIYTGIKTYKTEYYTYLNGQQILVSGLIHMPDSLNESTAFLSFQHGTTFKKSDAPSEATSPLGLLAGTGYIAIEADYIGYGSSKQNTHPYYDRTSSADAAIDLLYATRQHLRENGINDHRKIFLAGYSEGGYVTMAMLHKIENELPNNDLKIEATAAGAGGYDLNHMLTQIFSKPTYPYPAYIGLLITGYNVTYNWEKPYSYFFSSPYAEKFPDLVNGSTSGSQVNAELTEVIEDLLNPDFVSELTDKDNNTSDFKLALQTNSIPAWNVNKPLRLYHGDLDDIIPLSNSTDLYNKLISKGSTSVTFHTLSGHDHGSGGEAMIVDMLPWFKSLK